MIANINTNTDAKKELIEKIFHENFNISNPKQAINQAAENDNQAEHMYSDSTRVFCELIQNADDASFHNGKLELNFLVLGEEYLLVSHDGREFDDSDIEAICSSGQSTKLKNKALTGYKGIGFKSVFLHSDLVYIYSNGFKFKFDKNYFTPSNCWQEDWGPMNINSMTSQVRKPWQKIPLWCNEKIPFEHIMKQYKNNFLIKFKTKESVATSLSFFKKMNEGLYFLIFLKSEKFKIKIFSIPDDILKDIYSKNLQLSNFLKYKFKKNTTDNIVELLYGSLKNDKEKFCVKKYLVKLDFSTEDEKQFLSSSNFPAKILTDRTVEIGFAALIENGKKHFQRDEVVALLAKHRLIYSFLPTVVNFNFPFIINSNFILDATRTQIIDHKWNELIFSKLAFLYDQFLQVELLPRFGNSYCNLIIQNLKFSSENFKQAFFQAIDYEYAEYFKTRNYSAMTKTKKIQNIGECFIQKIQIKYRNQILPDFFSFMQLIFDKTKLIEILNANKIKLDEDYEIDPQDEIFLKKIKKKCSKFYNEINENFILQFLLSQLFTEEDIYLKYFPNCLKILDSSKYYKKKRDSCLFSFSNIFKEQQIILCENKQWKRCSNVFCFDFFIEESELAGLINPVTQSISKEKSFINQKLSRSLDSEHLSILRNYGVEILSKEHVYSYILTNYKSFYNEENSIQITRMIIQYMEKISDIERKDIFTQMTNFKFLSKTGQFLYICQLNIGSFYNSNKIFQSFEDYSISENYFKGQKVLTKAQFLEFFKALRILNTQEFTEFPYNLETLNIIPYIDKEYIKCLNAKFKSLNVLKVQIIPTLKDLSNSDLSAKEHFFFKYYNNREVFANNKANKSKAPHYLIWYYIKKFGLIPTNKNKLKPINSVYCDMLVADVLEEISKIESLISDSQKQQLVSFLKEQLDFVPDTFANFFDKETQQKPLSYGLQQTKMLNYFSIDKSIRLLDKLEKDQKLKLMAEITANSGKNSSFIIKLFYEIQMLSIIKQTDFKKLSQYDFEQLRFSLINEDEEFSQPKDLFYLNVNNYLSNLKSSIVQRNAKENRKSIRLPNKNLFANEVEKINFLKFCKFIGLTIYEEENFRIIKSQCLLRIETKQEISATNFIENLFGNKIISQEDMILSKQLFDKINFYSCNNIRVSFKCNEINEKYDALLCYEYVSDYDSYDIYILQNDVYHTWRHSTIYPLLINALSHILFNGKHYKDLILNYFYKAEDYNIWIDKGFRALEATGFA